MQKASKKAETDSGNEIRIGALVGRARPGNNFAPRYYWGARCVVFGLHRWTQWPNDDALGIDYGLVFYYGLQNLLQPVGD